MSNNNYKDFSTEDFIFDENFIQWVLHPSHDSDLYWNIFLQNYPEKIQQIEEASFVITSIKAVDSKVSSERLDNVYQKVLADLKPAPKIHWVVSRIAAVFLLLVSIG